MYDDFRNRNNQTSAPTTPATPSAQLDAAADGSPPSSTPPSSAQQPRKKKKYTELQFWNYVDDELIRLRKAVADDPQFKTPKDREREMTR